MFVLNNGETLSNANLLQLEGEIGLRAQRDPRDPELSRLTERFHSGLATRGINPDLFEYERAIQRTSLEKELSDLKSSMGGWEAMFNCWANSWMDLGDMRSAVLIAERAGQLHQLRR